MRALFATAIIFACSVAAPAQNHEYTVDSKVLFGWVKRADGTKVSLEGASIPITFKKIAESAHIGPQPFGIRGAEQNIAAFTAYQNDHGPDSYFYTPGNASSLDDIVLNGGEGVPWQWMKLGVNVEATNRVIVRWRIFDTKLQDTMPGQMAFTNEIADFGTYVQFGAPGVYSMDANVGIVGIVVPDGECYLAQQFRDDAFPNGEGPFEPAFSDLFSGGGVSVGTSEDIFNYDFDPDPNGIYEWQEWDYFGGTPNEANFFARMIVNGTAQELLPSSYTIVRGNYLGGALTDIWYDDQSFLSVQRGFVPSLNEAPINVEVQTVAPTTSILSMTFNAQVWCDKNGLLAKLELFNYNSNQWVMWDSWTTNGVEQTRSLIVTSNPGQYVQSGTRNVKARLTVKRGPSVLGTTFKADIDRMTWNIVR